MLEYKAVCVIPAYNEDETIKEVVNSVKDYVDEIVVVDDASEKDLREVLGDMPRVTVLRHIINRGQGAALQTGTEYALQRGADIIVHFDADGQLVAEEIKDIIAPIKKGEADIVFGSRFLEKKSRMPWFKKNIIMPLARIIIGIFLGVNNLTDPQSGFRAMSAETARKIVIGQDRMAHCSEILFKAFKGNFRVKEVPTTAIYNNFGQRFSGGLKILKELILGKLIN